MTLVDTNVNVDLTGDDVRWREWSADKLSEAMVRGGAFINDVVFAELSSRYSEREELERYVTELGIGVRRTPRSALFLAGQAYASYRRSGGQKLNVLPDIFIGAHALELEVPLLTRDPRPYRTYFPTLELICP